MSYIKVAMQLYVKRGERVLRGADFTINREGNLNMPQIAVGIINALMDTWCEVNGIELDAARKLLSEVQAGIDTLRYEQASDANP